MAEYGQLLDGLGAIFGGRRASQAASDRIYGRIDRRDAMAEEERQRQAQLSNQIRVTLLGKYIETMNNPEIQLSPEQRAMMQGELGKILGTLTQEEVSPGLMGALTAPRKKTVKPETLMGLAKAGYSSENIQKWAENPVPENFAVLGSPAPKDQKMINVAPGGMVFDPVTGETKFENTNPRWNPNGRAVGFRERVANGVVERGNQLRQSADPNKLSDRMKLAMQAVDEDVANGLTTPSNGDKKKAGIEGYATNLHSFDNAADKAIEILENTPESATIAGGAAKGIVDMAANAQALFNLIPGVNRGELDLSQNDWSDKLNEFAGGNTELQTILYNLALTSALATGLQNQRLSNQMIEQALNNIGANIRSPRAIKRKIKEVRARLADGLETSLQFASRNYTVLDKSPEKTTEPTPEEAAAELRRRGRLTDGGQK